MRNTHRVAAVAGTVLIALGAGAGLAFAGDKGRAEACVNGPEQALINAPAFNCADVDVSDVTDTTTTTTTTITDALNEVVDDVLNDLDLPLVGED